MEANYYYIIYQNAYKLLEFRGAGNVVDAPKIKEQSEIINYLNNNDERIIIKTEKMQIVLLYGKTKYMKSVGLKSMFTAIGDRHTILIVPAITDFKSVVTFLMKWEADKIERKPDHTLFTAPVRVEMNTHDVLMFDFPTHVNFTKYSLYPKVNELLQTTERDLSDLPKVTTTDTSLFWHGFKHGDVVIAHVYSPTAGIANPAKLVINNISFGSIKRNMEVV